MVGYDYFRLCRHAGKQTARQHHLDVESQLDFLGTAQGEAEGALFPLGRLDGQECLHGDAGVTPAGALQLVHVTQVADRPLLRREARHPAESIKLNSRIQISMFVLFLHLTL